MAYLDDLNEEERRRLEQGGSSAAPGGGTGGPAVSAGGGQAPTSSGFVNLGKYFDVNREAAGEQGAALAETLGGQADAALSGDDPGQAMSTLGSINAAATPGGLASVVQKDGGPNYSAGMAGLDAYLSTKGAEPGAFQGLKDLYGPKLPKVESAVEDPGVAGGGDPNFNFYTWPGWDEWRQKATQYEDWRKRRAENIGETYTPTYNLTLGNKYGG